MVSSNSVILVGVYVVASLGFDSTVVVENFIVVECVGADSFFFGSLVTDEVLLEVALDEVLWDAPLLVDLVPADLAFLAFALFRPQSKSPKGSKSIPKEVAMNLNKAPIAFSF